MERRRPDGLEWSVDEQLEMIIQAGFDGAGVRFLNADYARHVTRVLRNRGLSWQAQCYPKTVGALYIRIGQGIAREFTFDDAQVLAEPIVLAQMPFHRITLVRWQGLSQ